MRQRAGDRGFTIVELAISMAIMLLVLTAVVFFANLIGKGNDAIERQDQFARNISTPLHVMDKALSQNVALIPSFTDPHTNITYSTTDLQSNTIVMRSPMDPDTRKFNIKAFIAQSDGRLVGITWIVDSTTGAVSTGSKVVWSETNSNVARSVPLFQIRDASNIATSVPNAANVVVKVVTSNTSSQMENTQEIDSERVVFFRNR